MPSEQEFDDPVLELESKLADARNSGEDVKGTRIGTPKEDTSAQMRTIVAEGQASEVLDRLKAELQEAERVRIAIAARLHFKKTVEPMLAEVGDDVWNLVELAHAYQHAARIEAQHATPDAVDRLERARGDFRLALNLAIAKAPDKLTTPFLILRGLKAEVARA